MDGDVDLTIQLVFGVRIRECRLARGMSLRALADRAAVNMTYLGQVERGERNPSLVIIIRLADALRVSPAVLVHGMGSAERTSS